MSFRDWKVGDKVVCVDDFGAPSIYLGRVYTIASIFPARGLPDSLGRVCAFACTLVEAEAVQGLGAFNAARFRPVQKRTTDISTLRALLLNPFVKIGEDA